MSASLRRRAGVFGSIVVLIAVALGMTLLGCSIRRYPGGTAMDPKAAGHSFWFNFLCDLTNDVAVNGRSNSAGALLGRTALVVLAVALTSFWLILPESFQGRCGRTMAVSIRVGGVMSVAGLLVVPVATGWGHVIAIFASSVPALFAGILGLIGTLLHSRTGPLVAIATATVLAAALDSVLYAASYLAQPRVVGPALPLFQRLALLLVLAWMAMVAHRVLRLRASPGNTR